MEDSIIVCSVDTETTGLHPETDEILQLSIVDENGSVIFNEYFCPSYHLAWDEAEKINHITPEMVVGKPTIKERLAEINSIFARCNTIIGYKTGFDLSFLKAAGVEIPNSVKVIDVQQMYMGIVASVGKWDWEHNRPKWRSLRECAEFCHYEWEGEAHDSLADARATMACYSILLSENERITPLLCHPKPLNHCPFCGGDLLIEQNKLVCESPGCDAVFEPLKDCWHLKTSIVRALEYPYLSEDSIIADYEKYAADRTVSETIAKCRSYIMEALRDTDVIVSFSEHEDIRRGEKNYLWRMIADYKFKAREEVQLQDGKKQESNA